MKKLPIFIATLSLTACAYTSLEPTPPNSHAVRLSDANSHPLALSVHSELPEGSIGRQFGLFILPLGIVELHRPAEHLHRVAFETIAMRGYSLRPQGATLDLTLRAASCSAYDVFFIRRVVCTATVHARTAVTQSERTGVSTKWSMKPYAAVLQFVLDRALRDALPTPEALPDYSADY